MVSEGLEGFDVAGVLPPAAWDDVVVQVWVTGYERLDPSVERCPLAGMSVAGDGRPEQRGGDRVQVGWAVGAEELSEVLPAEGSLIVLVVARGGRCFVIGEEGGVVSVRQCAWRSPWVRWLRSNRMIWSVANLGPGAATMVGLPTGRAAARGSPGTEGRDLGIAPVRRAGSCGGGGLRCGGSKGRRTPGRRARRRCGCSATGRAMSLGAGTRQASPCTCRTGS